MDDITAEYLSSLNLPRLRLVALRDIEDETLLAVKAHRTLGEYCWTCTSPLVIYVQELYPEGTLVTYVDADIAFFSDPEIIASELGSGSIFIHEHGFAPNHAELMSSSGRFNVGVTAFRNDEQGRACLALWRRQCIDECVMDPAAGKCGDQNYLDDWPDLYPGLVISANPGVGLAPWNIEKYALSVSDGVIMVNETPAVFYHFHGLRLMRPRLRVHPTLSISGNYRMPAEVIRTFYRPYAREVWETAMKFPLIVASLKPVPDLHPRMEDDQILFSFLGQPLPVERNAATMSYLYGFDPKRQTMAPSAKAG